jgi:hypothetical protein
VEVSSVLESTQVDFTVSDLVHGWDDVRLLLNAADPDEAFAAVSSWPRQRAVAALVAAVTVLRPDEVVAGHSRPSGPDSGAIGQRSSRGQDGQVFGHLSVADWPR